MGLGEEKVNPLCEGRGGKGAIRFEMVECQGEMVYMGSKGEKGRSGGRGNKYTTTKDERARKRKKDRLHMARKINELTNCALS